MAKRSSKTEPGEQASGGAAQDAPQPTFEEAVSRVESIIERIESGEMGLEDQIEQYARGAELLKRCRDVLDRCEQRVEEITSELDDDGAAGDE